MKAFVINRYKDPLREADVPEPALGDRDVLVQVKAASANQLDEKIRLGEFKQILPYRLPLILGNDLAGVVAAVGPLVRIPCDCQTFTHAEARGHQHVRKIRQITLYCLVVVCEPCSQLANLGNAQGTWNPLRLARHDPAGVSNAVYPPETTRNNDYQ
jgi:hypothetical protein